MLRTLIFAALVSTPLLFAQSNEKKSATGEATPESQKGSGLIRDERIAVENLSFWKKFAADGKGDYLEFTFDIVNKTEDEIPLKMFIIAFNERDLVDSEYRRYVEYPAWRKWDEDKAAHKIVLYNSIPETKHEDVAAFARKKEEAIAKNGGFKPREEEPQPTGSKKKQPTLKQFLDYVQYIHENPTTGTDVLLQGFEDAKFTRKVEPTLRIEEKALKTNVWGKLLARYRVDRKFFNHFGIILYDTEAKKIVHRQFYSINGKFKIY
ncbi:MAG TPA: hypothetical protein PLY93_03500 [Turneriella sp.]|nr:hypothetical protein [Turneriella sp.]